MTQEEILEMQPGNQLSKEVAEKVMGSTLIKDDFFGYMERSLDLEDGNSVWSPLQNYSEDISAAELVVKRMIEMGYDDAIYWKDFGEGKYTEAEAICKAALLAILEESG